MEVLSRPLSAIALALISHHCYFKYGEHHVHAIGIVFLYILAALVVFATELSFSHHPAPQSVMNATSLIAIYAATIGCSIFSYRIWFHPLHRFHGPFAAKMTKFWSTWKARRSQNFLVLEDLHHSYGDFVRTGPNEITVFRPEAVKAMDGPQSKCIKSPWYDLMLPRVSVATTRSKQEHVQRRKIWNKAFGTQMLREHQPRVVYFANQLHTRLRGLAGAPVNVSFLFYLYSFDVMSDIAFGEPLRTLESDQNHYAVRLLHDGMGLLGPFSSVPWLVRIGIKIPGIAQHYKKLFAWSVVKLRERLEMNDAKKQDIMSWLIEAHQSTGSSIQDPWLRGDCFAIIIAGSDTVASTLVSMFWHMADDPSQVQKLRDEFQRLDQMGEVDYLQSYPHLDGMVNECLRLHPALPSGGLRTTPPEGITVGSTYIPGNVTICAPRYSLGRLESCYVNAQKFIPERWYSKPELVRDASGFSPFSIGSHNCVGKRLAMAQLRSVVKVVVSSFEIGFAPGEDKNSVWENLKDQFNAHPGKLHLVFSVRNSK